MIAPIIGKVGHAVTFEGYADDYGTQIVAIEFTLDDGATWASQDVSASDPNKSVHWTYTFTPTQPGIHQLRVRSVTVDGRKSPIAAVGEIHAEA